MYGCSRTSFEAARPQFPNGIQDASCAVCVIPARPRGTAAYSRQQKISYGVCLVSPRICRPSARLGAVDDGF